MYIIKKNLVNGHTKSCGCLFSDELSSRKTKHGLSSSRTYSIWCNMKERCSNPNHKTACYYVTRGITYDSKWEKFEGFLEDMGIAPDGLSLERIDNNGNYCKANCKWATHFEQTANQNKKRSNTSGRTGVHYSKREDMWKSYISVNKVCIHGGTFESFEEAVASREALEIKYWGKVRTAEYEKAKEIE
jgi:hypothetical protein